MQKKLKANCKFVLVSKHSQQKRFTNGELLKGLGCKMIQTEKHKDESLTSNFLPELTKFLMKNHLVQFAQFLETLTKIFQQYTATQQFTLGEFTDYQSGFRTLGIMFINKEEWMIQSNL